MSACRDAGAGAAAAGPCTAAGGGIRVIGAGLGRTGTMSFKMMLAQLGYAPYHMDTNTHVPLWAALGRASSSDLQDKATERVVDAIVRDGFNATTDFPACLVFEYLMVRFPDAKVVLTVRKSGRKWAKSVQRTIGRLQKLAMKRPLSLFADGLLRNHIDMNHWIWTSPALKIRMNEETGAMPFDDLAMAHDEWKQHVIDTVPADRLLIRYPQDGWLPLCSFLNVPEKECPTGPTPRSWNTSKNFGAVLDVVEIVLTLWLCIIAVVLWMMWRKCRRMWRDEAGGRGGTGVGVATTTTIKKKEKKKKKQ